MMSFAIRNAAFAALLSACGAQFLPVSAIDRPRILGAVMDVAGVHAAVPLPGETVTMRLLTAVPAGQSDQISAMGLVCVAGDVRRGAGFCAGVPMPMRPLGATTFEFDVPPEAAFVAARSLLIVGAACLNGGVPTIDVAMQRAQCPNDGRSEMFSYSVAVARPGDARVLNPDVSMLDLQYQNASGEMQSLPSDRTLSCDALPQVVLSGLRRDMMSRRLSAAFELVLPAGVRARLPSDAGPDADADAGHGAPVAWQISQFSNYGDLSYGYTVWDAPVEMDRLRNAVTWRPPEMLPTSLTRVELHFVVRDLRGGQAMKTFAFCVAP